ncbi:hypothetical protein DFH08DRAFT_899315 [Mycena albidolilacea]|uniref:Uncharacterized protein n=1 Tax=Mycena albidolilacea TaxID=1033008 RepID=A0AAD6Z773_9AGAR|nr:hypothetical protein DFH08DRAFT_899315 [Mycena albidolilacea]
MFRDGAVYFGMVALVNLANIIAIYTGDVITSGSMAWFACSISATMISRLMLNLHNANNREYGFEPSSVEMEPIRFRDEDRL